MITMRDDEISRTPAVLEGISRDGERVGFAMASEPKTGALLRTLVAAKPGGRFLEIGTGTGVGTAWFLSGMDAASSLVTIESDSRVLDIARGRLGQDRRVSFRFGDGAETLGQLVAAEVRFDLVYADAWPGKFSHLDLALSLVSVGGIYFIDDLLPQENWPDGHADKVPLLIADLEGRADFVSVKMAWASGLMMLVRTGRSSA